MWVMMAAWVGRKCSGSYMVVVGVIVGDENREVGIAVDVNNYDGVV